MLLPCLGFALASDTTLTTRDNKSTLLVWGGLMLGYLGLTLRDSSSLATLPESHSALLLSGALAGILVALVAP